MDERASVASEKGTCLVRNFGGQDLRSLSLWYRGLSLSTSHENYKFCGLVGS